MTGPADPAGPVFVDTVAVGSALDEVLASLPLSLARGEGSPHIVAVDGAPGWLDRAADADAPAVVVVDPVSLVEEARRGRLETASDPARLGLDLPWSHNPVVPALADALGSADGYLEVRLHLADAPTEADALAVLHFVDRVAGELDSVRILAASPDHLRLTSIAGDHDVAVTLVRTAAADRILRLRALGADDELDVELPHPDTARPAHLITATDAGERSQPTLWESSHRALWRAAIAVARGEAAFDDLTPYLRAVRLLAAAR